ncbi:type IV-A pilus assembly ATPase PilB [Thermodesulfovibrio yellowstonii]|uniref:type IV-A pilus assembly ATPase PilB n=1 Tax=Thermodesulfovibrio yellowstonii TaxID=28262 RepID=UPI0024B36027|nr:type IV-A pilus assembly ATPase PilB [Thermodesulfovibrio yellowstonii]MDI6864485.1 type IV-A pilus assembly ATPase PilB [Thermodesulfovibrio yellowstonii]
MSTKLTSERLTIGVFLLKKGKISEKQLIDAQAVQKIEGIKIGAALIKLGYITEDELVESMSELYGYPVFKIDSYKIDPLVVKLLPEDVIRKYKVLPFLREGNIIRVLITDPANEIALEQLKFFLSGFKILFYIGKDSDFKNLINKFFGEEGAEIYSKETVHELVESAVQEPSITQPEEEQAILEVDAPLIRLVNQIIVNAISKRASDIHIEPFEDNIYIRYRIDGVLHDILTLPPKLKSALITRIKIMANMDISERRLPQDGRIKMKIGKKEVDFRVSTLPSIFGEKIVLRILEKGSLQLDLTKLGFEEESLNFFIEALSKPYGMILVTGPTGSGKTPTLYSSLMKLRKPEVNIVTVEDPVEYTLPRITQVQVQEDIGRTFAQVLRSFLRQDPDIILVGEIRDFETAEIAIKAALTGHLVLSTLHTNDAPSTITRLVNMGIEPFLIASSVILIVAQRLVRKLCESCKKEQKISKETFLKLGFPEESFDSLKIYEAQGCAECNQTGYRGRVALYEVMPIKDEIRELILTGASTNEIKKEAIKLGMLTLRHSGIRKIMAGITSIEEVLRVTVED